MNAAKSHFQIRIENQMDRIVPGISRNVGTIPELQADQGQAILSVLLGHACQGQNDAPIIIARNLIKQIPTAWLESNLSLAISNCLQLDDEWEYRRLLELLNELSPKLLRKYADIGRKSKNAEVREAMLDFSLPE